MQGNPFNNIPHPGDHMEWNPLVIEFPVDDDLSNYLEISNWMRALYFPKEFEQYAELVQKGKEFLGKGIRSEISLLILNGQQTPIIECLFSGAFPVGLSELDFDTKSEDLMRVTTTATFVYESYTIKKLI
jgi:hypothetical protein